MKIYELALPLVGIVLLTGCGPDLDLPELAPVSGKVTVGGQPLTRGIVQFVPDAERGNAAPAAVGEIQPDGSYTLVTAGQAGAPVGFHKVKVTARAEPKDETDTLPESLIPMRYENPDASGLTAEVKANQSNTIHLPLEAQ